MQDIAIVAAINQQGAIGVDNQLPWHIREDLQRFKQLTLNKPIIMGRKTFESIGRVLPQRENIVITRNITWQYENVRVLTSLDAAINACNNYPEICIIGGGEVYAQALDVANIMHLTIVDMLVPHPDVFFPVVDYEQWQLVHQQEFVSENGINCAFKDYHKKLTT